MEIRILSVIRILVALAVGSMILGDQAAANIVELSFTNPQDGIELSASLQLPNSNGPHPAVILIGGDGPQTRDEPMLVATSQYLADRGWAVLRADKRGTGKSSGDLGEATTRDLANDVAAGFDLLRQDRRVTPNRVGLIGHSEGSLIAVIVAAQRQDVAFAVLLAYPVVGIEETLQLQKELHLRHEGASDRQLQNERRYLDLVVSGVRQNKTNAEILDAVSGLRSEVERSLEEEEFVEELRSPWFRFLLDYTPSTGLKKIRCPLLALYPEKDWQVVPAHNKEALLNILQETGVNCQIIDLPGLNHRLQLAKTGSRAEYPDLGDSISVIALEHVGDWIDRIAP